MPIKASEQLMTRQLAYYLQLRHPNIRYHFDYGSGARLTQGQATAQKRLNRRGWPDVFIAQPVGDYHGLFLELKKADTKLLVKSGELVADPHIREQAQVLLELDRLGYRAQFAVGLDEAIRHIESYLAPLDPAGSRRDTMF